MAICEALMLSNFYGFAPSRHLLASVPVGLGKANTEHVTSEHPLKTDVRLDSGQSWNAVTESFWRNTLLSFSFEEGFFKLLWPERCSPAEGPREALAQEGAKAAGLLARFRGPRAKLYAGTLNARSQGAGRH